MEEIIGNLENLLVQFQSKFLEIEDILHNANKQFSRLKLEHVKCAPQTEDSVMSMKDFVSYMSALEETEADETSQNISDLPLDNDESMQSEQSATEETPIQNSNTKPNQQLQPFERTRMRKSYSNSFGWHEVIHEEDENVEGKENRNMTGPANKRQRHKSESNLNESCIKRIPRPTSIITNPNVFKRPHSAIKSQTKDITKRNMKPTNLDFVNIRVRPDLKTFPVVQHPETALLASATPSPMTPSDDKVPRMDLDKINNNPTQKNIIKTDSTNMKDSKLHIKESKLPISESFTLPPFFNLFTSFLRL